MWPAPRSWIVRPTAPVVKVGTGAVMSMMRESPQSVMHCPSRRRMSIKESRRSRRSPRGTAVIRPSSTQIRMGRSSSSSSLSLSYKFSRFAALYGPTGFQGSSVSGRMSA